MDSFDREMAEQDKKDGAEAKSNAMATTEAGKSVADDGRSGEPAPRKHAVYDQGFEDEDQAEADEQSSLKGKTRQRKQKSDQQAKEPVKKEDGNADPTQSGGAKVCKTKFADFTHVYE